MQIYRGNEDGQKLLRTGWTIDTKERRELRPATEEDGAAVAWEEMEKAAQPTATNGKSVLANGIIEWKFYQS
ncbi:hypothetical protein V7S43_010254 [Phytophthora oleae]|uniref:Uncharacterized protein n=1 Tax=Phytophthora oleae TaxID=2107226 RepID=A0ABD3FC68_9STRA